MAGKDGKDPYHTECTGSDQRYNGRKHGISEPSNGTRKDIHNTAKAVKRTYVSKSGKANRNYLRIFIIQR